MNSTLVIKRGCCHSLSHQVFLLQQTAPQDGYSCCEKQLPSSEMHKYFTNVITYEWVLFVIVHHELSVPLWDGMNAECIPGPYKYGQ